MAKKLREVEDKSPGRVNHHNTSMTSLGNISVDYNEGSAVAKRNKINERSNFLKKSQSISAI